MTCAGPNARLIPEKEVVMKKDKISKIPERERKGIIVKRPARKPLVSEEEKKEAFERELRRLNRKYEPLLKAVRDSEILTAKDFSITINTR